jgi:hypothetical protein
MSTTIKNALTPSVINTFLLDAAALGFIALMPAASHLTGIPFYFLEPMRVMLALSLIFTSRSNSFLIAVSLPLFSFLVSGHPFPLKMGIIMAELLLNAWIFTFLYQKYNRVFFSMFSAIILSKVFCYLGYWIVFSWAFVAEEAAPVFILSQLAVTVIISAGISIVASKYSLRSVQK